MRTTVTLDKDVAAVIARLRKTRDASMKEIINEALREGLTKIASPRRRHRAFRTTSADLGRCLVGSVDNVAEALAIVENETFR